MLQEDQKNQTKRPSIGERILWTLVAIFIVSAIGAMVIGDYYYAPGAGNPKAVKDAVEN